MTNPERTVHSEQERDFPTISRDEADRLIADLMPLMPTRKAAKRIRDLYDEAGPPVAVFLYFEDVDPAAEDIEQQFHGNYFGSYTRGELIEIGLEVLGYDERLGEFLRTNGLPENALSWNPDAVWPLIRDSHHLVQEEHYFHVFDATLAPSQEADQ